MRTLRVAAAAAAVFVVVVVGSLQAVADDDSFAARLTGFEEIPTLSVPGTGRFTAELDDGTLRFTLRYQNLTGPAHMAHIHLGRPWVAGGVIAFLCGGGGQAACPGGTSGTVTGEIRAAHVVGPVDQGIAPGEFRELVRALRAGATYVNVHTDAFGTGEIRGQIRDRD
jgi:hypothetical protein